jgi:hypothetical protein
MGRPELARALASLAVQDYPGLEVVLVLANPEFGPDASLLRGNVRVVSTGTRLKRPDAANLGLSGSQGEWIGFLDEDDWMEPLHLRTLMAAVAGQPGFRLVYGDLAIHDGDQVDVRSMGYWKARHTENPIPHLDAALCARELIEAGCAFDPSFELMEDWDFFVQCGERTDFLHVNAVVAHYHAQTGTSGCGLGPNRDDARMAPYLARLNSKWGTAFRRLAGVVGTARTASSEAMKANDWPRAARHLAHGLQVDPGNPLLLNHFAYCMRQLGDWPAVHAALQRACDVDRGVFTLRCDLVYAEYKLGRLDHPEQALAALRDLAQTPQQSARLARMEEMLRTPA